MGLERRAAVARAKAQAAQTGQGQGAGQGQGGVGGGTTAPVNIVAPAIAGFGVATEHALTKPVIAPTVIVGAGTGEPTYCPIKFQFEKRFHSYWNKPPILFETFNAWADNYNDEFLGKLGGGGSAIGKGLSTVISGVRKDGSLWIIETHGNPAKDQWYHIGNSHVSGAVVRRIVFYLPILTDSPDNRTTFSKKINDVWVQWEVRCFFELDGKKVLDTTRKNAFVTNVYIDSEASYLHPAGTLSSPRRPHEVTLVIEWDKPSRGGNVASRAVEDILNAL